MTMPWRVLPAVVLAATAAAQSLPCHDLGGAVAVAQDLLATHPLTGSSCLRIDQHGQTLLAQPFGTFTLQEVVPIASASKTLSAAVLLSLVDSGLCALDDRVGQYLPEWNLGARAAITLRMCFTHTAGLPGNHPAVGDDTITLRQAAQQLATAPLLYAPGTAFDYGGVSMHVAGAVCEVVAGVSWAQLFTQRIAAPLQMTATDFFAFGPTANPRIAGGARSNLRDFAVFCDMLRAGGQWNGATVLSAASVATMLSDQTSGLPILGSPHPDQAPYGVGIWLERRDSAGQTLLAAAVGAFGFAGWVDRAHDASGVLLVQSQNQITFPYTRRIWQQCDDALLPPGATCVGTGSPACASGSWLNGSGRVRQGNLDFAVRVARAPAGMPGLLMSGAPTTVPLPVGDLLAFVGAPFLVAGSAVADGDGRAAIAAPLAPGLAGQTFGVQAVWLSPAPCAALALQASHALRLDVLP